MIKAVITGDIIQSTRMSKTDRNRLINELDKSFKLWSKDYNLIYELYRGDSFQCVINNPADALRVTLIIKTFIKSYGVELIHQDIKSFKIRLNERGGLVISKGLNDCRISIGIGETEKNGNKIATSNGEAFILSGRGLDEIKSNRQTIGIHTKDIYVDELATESILLDYILSKSTASQSEVICWKLLGYTETWISDELKVAQSAVNQRAGSSGWFAIEKMVQRFEKIYANEK